MSYSELKCALRDKLGVKDRALYCRVDKLKKQCPMNTRDGMCLLAHREGIFIDKYLDEETLARVRELDQHVAIFDTSEDQRKARKGTTRIVNVTIGGKFKLEDPILPIRVLDEAKKMANIYAEIYVFENSVREVILRVMSKAYGDTWWESCVQKEIKDKVEGRRKKEKENPWHGKRRAHEIYYTDMPELYSIIKKHWADFTGLFPSQVWLEQKFNEIVMSRNIIDHHNPLNKNDIKRIEIYFGDWCRQIESVKDLLIEKP